MEKMDALFKLTHNIPKIELHAHIGGCFRPQTFMNLCLLKKIDIDHIDFYNVDIATAFEIFKVGGKLITDAETLRLVTSEIIEDYSKQNTRYLELRSTPKSVGSIASKEEYINIILETMSEMEKRIP
jgi:adenosine deaminase